MFLCGSQHCWKLTPITITVQIVKHEGNSYHNYNKPTPSITTTTTMATTTAACMVHSSAVMIINVITLLLLFLSHRYCCCWWCFCCSYDYVSSNQAQITCYLHIPYRILPHHLLRAPLPTLPLLSWGARRFLRGDPVFLRWCPRQQAAPMFAKSVLARHGAPAQQRTNKPPPKNTTKASTVF